MHAWDYIQEWFRQGFGADTFVSLLDEDANREYCVAEGQLTFIDLFDDEVDVHVGFESKEGE